VTYYFAPISVQHSSKDLDYREQAANALHPVEKLHVLPRRSSRLALTNTTSNVHPIFCSSSFATRSHCLRDLLIRGLLRRLWSTASLKAAYCHESRSYSIPWPCRHPVPAGAQAGPGFRIKSELSVGRVSCAFAVLAVSCREVQSARALNPQGASRAACICRA
jgi:hypothetical protein